MPAENMVLRTVYVDPDVDEQLRALALSEHKSKADLFRRFVAVGFRAVKSNPELLEAYSLVPEGEGDPLVLRTVHMDPKLDERLRVEAFDTRTSKNDLLRRYVRIGMNMHARQHQGGRRGGPLREMARG